MIEFPDVRFDRQQLERSMPLDSLRILSGTKGEQFTRMLTQQLLINEKRGRRRRHLDFVRWQHTLNVLIANLALGVFNRVDNERFIAISLNRSDYTGLAISITALADLVDRLAKLGLIEGQRGYRNVEHGAVLHARRTRIRGTARLKEQLSAVPISKNDIGWSERRDSIILREPESKVRDEPNDVTESRKILEKINLAISEADLSLPDEAWTRVTERYRTSTEAESDRLVSGEEATALYRIFKGSWSQGGRLYGGWWINLPKAERALIKLENEPTVERDFARLHPTLLYARVGVELDFDLYTVPGFDGPMIRELGKRTFNRLINRSAKGRPHLSPTILDREQLPFGVSFKTYLAAFVERLGPISQWFGTGEGMRLQKEDSDLAIAILGRLLDAGIVALPVHDSFIVDRRHESALVEAMEIAFGSRYGFTPVVR